MALVFVFPRGFIFVLMKEKIKKLVRFQISGCAGRSGAPQER